jgi:hypothetical protein
MLKKIPAKQLTLAHKLWAPNAQAPCRVTCVSRYRGQILVDTDQPQGLTLRETDEVYVTNEVRIEQLHVGCKVLVGDTYEEVKWVRSEGESLAFKTDSGVHTRLRTEMIELC